MKTSTPTSGATQAPTGGAAPLPRHPPFWDCVAAIRQPALYKNFAVHIFVMFPAAMLMCWIAAQIDAAQDIQPLWDPTLRLLVGLLCIGVGGAWVWYVYGFLFLAGGGSPGTHVDGGPTTMVDTGPYTAIRHPSVIGKLLGVTGLGVAWGSFSFLAYFVPVLVVYSLITNRLLQERFCDQRFGARYDRYRAAVPMLVPRPAGLARWWRGEPALAQEAPPEAAEAHPPGIWSELRWYLLGLVLLVTTFGGLWAALGGR
jgi:protein-S-isoprenylcysteine O-methyltransferase Ste14